MLIDFPADTASHCTRYGINLGKIENILITHSHSDHYAPELARFRCDPYAHDFKYEKLYFYGSENLKSIYDAIDSVYGPTESRENIKFVCMENRNAKKIGKYTVTPMLAKHAPAIGSLNYIIEEEGTSLLYLVDTGYPTDETLDYLEGLGKVFNCIVMDSTMGDGYYVYHMNFDENKKLKDELTKRRLADGNTRFVITHITHNGAETHDKIEKIFEETDITVAYDGIEIEI